MGELIIAGKLTRMVKATLEDTWSYVRVPTFISGPLDIMNGLRKAVSLACLFRYIVSQKVIKDSHIQTIGPIFTKSTQLIAAVLAFTARTSGRNLLPGRCSWGNWIRNKSDLHAICENEYKKSFRVTNRENWDSDNSLLRYSYGYINSVKRII